MFEVNSASAILEIGHLPAPKAPKQMAKSLPRSKTKNFPALSALLSNWDPSDSTASRSLLIKEIIIKLEKSGHKCTHACIPALIIDDRYPLELMHYGNGRGLDEFKTRMLWMNEEYQAAIGILVGVPDDKTSAMIGKAYEDLFSADKNCIVILL
jgi:hypothetical protein